MFTCSGCQDVALLVREVADMRRILQFMKREVTAHELDEKTTETVSRVAGL